jgi:hypothetical protein
MSQQPSRGGSYVQDKDGALKRVAFTASDAGLSIASDAGLSIAEANRVRAVVGIAPQAEPVAKTQSVAPAKGRKSKE